MKKYIAKRLLQLVVVVLGLSFLTFALMYIAPGDPAEKKLSAQGIAVDPEVLAATRAEMGLDRPFLEQYADWLGGLFSGDLGESYRSGRAVADMLGESFVYTLELTVLSLAAALAISLPLALLAAVRQNSIADFLVRIFSFIGNSLPNFLISVLLMYYFCVKLRLLPVISDGSAKGFILPCLALAIPLASRFVRQFRAEILEQLGKEYVDAALSRGVKMRYILFCNVLHNALIPMITLTALSVGTLMGGSVVIETVFRLPGLGKLAMDAISARDYPVIQGFVLLSSGIYVLLNLAADLLYRAVDPRVEEGGDAG